MFFANRAHMGTYRESNDYAIEHHTTPVITQFERDGALKYGFGFNTEQLVTANLRVFGRFGWNEGQ